MNPENVYWKNNKIVGFLEEISVLGIRQCFPLLLAARSMFDDKEFIKNIRILH